MYNVFHYLVEFDFTHTVKCLKHFVGDIIVKTVSGDFYRSANKVYRDNF